jgi:hypothetical protein
MSEIVLEMNESQAVFLLETLNFVRAELMRTLDSPEVAAQPEEVKNNISTGIVYTLKMAESVSRQLQQSQLSEASESNPEAGDQLRASS